MNCNLFNLLLIFLISINFVIECNGNIRNKRFLLFPQGNPTRHQFIAGVGIPVDLQQESVNLGYVFKAQYYLPYNVSQFVPTVLTGERRKRDYAARYVTDSITGQKYEQYDALVEEIPEESSSEDEEKGHNEIVLNGRWILYKYLEEFMERNGFIGRSCILKSICEAADVKFSPTNGLLDELFHIIFSPSTTNDLVSLHTDNEYYRAEQLGKSEPSSCHLIFNDCNKSILQLFSKIYNPFTNLFD